LYLKVIIKKLKINLLKMHCLSDTFIGTLDIALKIASVV
jgi:hypothetical protein